MISKYEILTSVSSILHKEFPNVPIYADNKVHNFQTDAFFIDIVTLGRNSEAQHYTTKKFLIDIAYTHKENNNLKLFREIEDKLIDEIFTDYLDIKGKRKPRINNQNSNLVENEIHITFEISFIDEVKDKDIDYDTMRVLKNENELVKGGKNVNTNSNT